MSHVRAGVSVPSEPQSAPVEVHGPADVGLHGVQLCLASRGLAEAPHEDSAQHRGRCAGKLPRAISRGAVRDRRSVVVARGGGSERAPEKGRNGLGMDRDVTVFLDRFE